MKFDNAVHYKCVAKAYGESHSPSDRPKNPIYGRTLGKSSVPSYSIFETYLGHGIVGGRLVGFEVQGKKAAQYALAILKGKKPSDLPITSYGTIVPMFDWRQLQRWGLDEQRLPEGSIVRFKELTTWEEHKWYIIGGISLFIIEAILILLLLFNWARRLKAESALTKSHKELEHRVEERTAELSKRNEQLKEEITDRKRAQNALKESEGKFRNLYENSPFGILICQMLRNEKREFADFIHIEENQSVHITTGFELNQLVGKKASEIVDSKTLTELVELYGSVISTGKPIHYEQHFDVYDRTLEVTAFPLHDDFFIINFINVSKRIRAEEEKKKLETKLQRAQKMEAMGLMAGGIAHDLNNILSGIVSYPELLLMDLPKDSPLRDPIKTIQESGMRAADVVTDLMTIARGVASGKEVLNFNTIVDEYLNSTEHSNLVRLRPSVTFKTRFDSDLLNVNASPTHMKKILMNLVINASEAIVGSGTVIISSMNRYLDEPLRGYEDVVTGEYVLLTVSDDGSGISQQDLERIFEPFYTKKVMDRSGTGLGLAVVWNSMQDHDGYINVKSSEEGTVFELYFPVTREKVAAEKEEVPIGDYLGHGEKILVVDDEERQRKIASGMLTRLGYTAETVSSGEEAIMYVKEQPMDLIVLDMVMPKGINGRETYEEIIKIRPGQKAIIASGYARTKEVDLAQELGAGKYIKKPYTLVKVGLAVKEELEK